MATCATCGTASAEAQCPSCGASMVVQAADPFADPFASPAPLTAPTRSEASGLAAVGPGLVTGRDAGTDLLPGASKKPLREIAGAAALLVFLIIVVVGFFPRIFGGFSNEPILNTFDAGTCFVIDGPSEISEESCDDPHDAEVIGFVDWIGEDEYPGWEPLEDWASVNCITVFRQYVGIDESESSLTLGLYYPTATSWPAGDRRAVCAIQFTEGPESGSVRDSRR